MTAARRCTVELIDPGTICPQSARFTLAGGVNVCRHHLGYAVERHNELAAPYVIGGTGHSVPVWIIRDEKD